MMEDIFFYTVDGCSLCEQAEQWFELLGAHKQYKMQKINLVDADNSEALIIKYGEIVPVFLRNQQQLNAPFSLLDLQNFLK